MHRKSRASSDLKCTNDPRGQVSASWIYLTIALKTLFPWKHKAISKKYLRGQFNLKPWTPAQFQPLFLTSPSPHPCRSTCDLGLETEINSTFPAPGHPPLPMVEWDEKNKRSPWEQKITLAQAAAFEGCASHVAGKLSAHGQSRKTRRVGQSFLPKPSRT